MSDAVSGAGGRFARAGLFAAPLAAALLLAFVDPPASLSVEAWRTAAVALWMVIWWLSQAVPLPVTALLPVMLFPALEIRGPRAAAAPYANPVIFLFMGGFMLALALERWALHRRIALAIIRVVGTRPHAVVAGFMAAAAFLSMWISNTATAVMMVPIALSVAEAGPRPDPGGDGQGNESPFVIALLLAVAYGASIGGLGTLIGTPPNALLAGFMAENYGMEIGFGHWMLAGIPMVAVLLPIGWLLLTRVFFRLDHAGPLPGAQALRDEIAAHAPLTAPQKRVAAVCSVVALAWLTRPMTENAVPGLSDAGIALAGAVALFVLPSGDGTRLLRWGDAVRLPWGILILFGGGLSLAAAVSETGLAAWIAAGIGGMAGVPIVLILAVAVATVVFLTELTSNTATAATFLPVAAALAVGLSQNPLLFAVPVAFAASCAFMMPVATPPNAIVFGSGHLTVGQMARVGLWLNLIAIALLVGAAYVLFNHVFGIDIGVVPDWASKPVGSAG